MAEDIGSLVVRVAMDNSNFQDGINNLNRSIRKAQSEFKNATAGFKDHGKGLEGLKAKQELLSKSIEAQTKIVEKYKSKIKESEDTLKNNTKEHVSLKSKVEEAKKAYKDSSKTLGENAKETEKLKEAYEKLEKEYANSEAKIRSNVRAIDNWNTKANNAEAKLKGMRQQLDSVSSGIKKQGDKWNQLSKKLEGISTKFDSLGNKMSSIGKGLSAKLTGPIVAMETLAAKSAMDFKEKIANIDTLLDDHSHLKGYEQQVLSVSKATGKSLETVSEGMYTAVSSLGDGGKKTQEIFKTMANAAKAGGADVNDSVALISAAMKGYGSVNDKTAKKISDLAFQTAKLGVTTFPEMAKSMQPLFPLSKSLNFSFEELFGSMSTLTGVTGNTSEVSTQLKAVFSNLMKPTTDMQKLIKKYGFSNAQAMVKSKGLVGIMKLLQKETGGNADKMGKLFSSTEAVTALTALTGQNFKDLASKTKEMKKAAGSTDAALKKVSNTTKDKFNKAINNFKVSLTQLGVALLPIVSKISDVIAKISNKFNSLTPAQQELIIKIAGIVAALGPALIVGSKINAVIGTVIGSVSKFSTVMAGGSSVVKAAIAALGGPATLITVGIMALVAAGIALYMNWDKIKAKAAELKKAISDKWNSIKKSTSDTWNSITNLISSSWNLIKNGTVEICNGIKSSIVNCWSSIKDGVSNSITNLKNSIINIWTLIKTSVANIISDMVAQFLEKFNDQAHLLSDVLLRIKNIFIEYWEVIKTIVLGVVLIICDIVTGNFDKLKTDASQIFEKLQGLIVDIWDNIKYAILNTCTAIKEIAIKIWHDIKEIIIHKVTEIKSRLIEIWNNIKTYISTTLNNLKTTCNNAWINIKTTTINIWNGLLNWFAMLPSKLYNLAINMFTSMKNGVVNTTNSVISSAKNIGTSIINAFKELPKQALEIGKNIIDGLWKGITNGVGKVVDAAKNLASNVSNSIRSVLDIHSPSRETYSDGKFTAEGLALGMKDNAYLVKEEASKLADSALKEVSKLSNIDIKIKANTNNNEILKNTGKMLNWGSNNKKAYEDFLAFKDKLNKAELEQTKEYIKEDYEARNKSLEDRLRILKNENAIELQNEKNRVDAQISYYQKLQKNSKNKNDKKAYSDKIAGLRQYQKAVLNTTKANQKAQIDSLEKSKKALKEYYEDGMQLLNNREKEVNSKLKLTQNLFKDTMNQFQVAIKKLSIDAGNLSSKLKNQNAIIILQKKKIQALRTRYIELCKVFGETSDEAIRLRKSFEEANNELVEMSNTVKETENNIYRQQTDRINNFNSKIEEALKERYTQELKLQEDKTNKELSNLNKWKDESIKRISDVYDAKIKSLDDELKAEEKADKDKEELNKIRQLEESLKYEHNEFNKVELQKELNKTISDRNKRLHREGIEEQKTSLENKKQNEINNINYLYEANKNNLEKQLEDTKTYYNEKMNLANLQAEAEKIIMDNNQQEIVQLIQSYDKDYENAGKTLGQKLADGMKKNLNSVLDMIQNIEDKIKNIRMQEIESAINTVKYKPILTVGKDSVNNSTTNNSTVVNNNNITFKSPKALSPAEMRRNTETTLRNLSFSI